MVMSVAPSRRLPLPSQLGLLAALGSGDQRRQNWRQKPRALQHDLPGSQTVQHRFLDTLTARSSWPLPAPFDAIRDDDSLERLPERA